MTHSGKARSILIVDDNIENIDTLVLLLKELGHTLIVAKSGFEAIRRIHQAIPDLILLDILMPGMDGFELCQELKTNPQTKEIPIIFMTALDDSKNKVKGFKLGAIDYITKPFQQEEVLARVETHFKISDQKRELEKLNAAKNTFFSIIGHDLRNLFSVLQGSSYILMHKIKTSNPEELQIHASRMHRSVVLISRLLENLLTWASSQLNTTVVQPRTINLHEAVQQSFDVLELSSHEKEISLSNGIGLSTPIFADKDMIQIILVNLLANAIKFSKHGSKVEVNSTEENGMTVVCVSDHGVGMDENMQRKLFRLDEHIRTLGTENEPGTGLGLILCKELVEKNHGRIWVESKLGEGTQFRFALPKSAASSVSSAGAPPAPDR